MMTLQNELKTIFKESNYNEDTDHDIHEVVDI